MSKRTMPVALALAVAVLAMVIFVGGGPGLVSAAPQRIGSIAITPVAATNPMGAEQSVLIKFFDGEVLTASDQECRDLREYRIIDLEYVVDQTLVAATPNASTVTLEHTNGAGASLAVNTTGQTVVAANEADADGLNRYDLYGVYTCVDIAVTNSNPVTWTVYAVARK